MNEALSPSYEPTGVQRLRERLNNVPIVVGCAIWFVPMTMFWGRFYPPLRPFKFEAPAPSVTTFAACLAVCLLPYALPRAYFRPRAFERGRFYTRLGVKYFRLLATDGDLINRRLRALDPAYRAVRTRASLRAHIQGAYSTERGHLAFFLAGLFTAGFALNLNEVVRAAILSAGNVAFNLYPLMHQRYKRARLRSLGSLGGTA